MKITLFIGSLYGGGAERVTCNLANYLVQYGYEIEILTMSETAKSYELNSNVTVRTLLPLDNRKNKLWNILMRFPRLWKYLITEKRNVYIVMLPKTTIMLLAFRWMTKAKVIAAERNNPNAYSKQIAVSLKMLASKADGWVFQTEDAKKWYDGYIITNRTTTIPNAINPVFIRSGFDGEKRKVIAGVGRLNIQKNFGLLINAYAQIVSEFPEYKLVIYGCGVEEVKLKEQVKKLGLQGRVEFPGNIQNIADEMEKNTMFVLSSDFEGMPNALMEAMALGLPCVATDCPCGGPHELIQDGVNGFLVPVGNVDKMVEAMKKVLSDTKKAVSIGQEATKIINDYAPQKIYGQWEKFIRMIAEDK